MADRVVPVVWRNNGQPPPRATRALLERINGVPATQDETEAGSVTELDYNQRTERVTVSPPNTAPYTLSLYAPRDNAPRTPPTATTAPHSFHPAFFPRSC
jgi:hypothetical protein